MCGAMNHTKHFLLSQYGDDHRDKFTFHLTTFFILGCEAVVTLWRNNPENGDSFFRPKRWYLPKRPNGVQPRRPTTDNFTAVRTLNPKRFNYLSNGRQIEMHCTASGSHLNGTGKRHTHIEITIELRGCVSLCHNEQHD
jgi:hypothetical protein